MGIFIFSQKNYWKKSSEIRDKEQIRERKNMPDKFLLYQVDLPKLKSELSNAPQRFSKNESLMINFPDSDGNFRNYIVQEASVMAPELQSQFPEIRSYVGWEKNNSGNTIRFSISPEFGLHIMYFDGWDVSYLDSYTKDNTTSIIYKRKDIKNTSNFECGVKESSELIDKNPTMKAPLVQDGQWRVYRLALATTGEYTAFHGGTVSAGLAAVNTTMTRVNGVFEKTISVHLQIVANNNLLIYTNSATDPYTNDDGVAMLDENQTNVDAIIGAANYDMGHVFSTGGGGIAYTPSVCNASVKAGGVTGSPAPVGDPFDIDYVAHEMGHQFSANHTFRANTGACSGNVNNATAMEPGSGTTIMAYAGICGTNNNVQSNSDPYFHAVSVTEMYSFITGPGNTCAVKTATGNNEPTANAGSDYIIPKGTAFVLTGTGSDPDGDSITYLWEQYDFTSNTQPPVSTATVGPVYRSRVPSTSPSRYFPVLSSVVANNLVPKWEVTPSVARTLNFNLLVSDNKATGGQSAKDAMVVTVTNDGPFTVTSHTSNIAYTANTATTVTWNVAGTNTGTINTQNVDILLSKDGGLTFTTVLLANTPNDGSQSVTLPNQNVASARIMVRAVGNIYYALNSSAFSITGGLSTNETESGAFVIYPNPASTELNIRFKKGNENADYLIFDAAARLIKKGNVKGDSKIKLNGFKSGNYIIVVELEGGEKYSEKLIIK